MYLDFDISSSSCFSRRSFWTELSGQVDLIMLEIGENPTNFRTDTNSVLTYTNPYLKLNHSHSSPLQPPPLHLLSQTYSPTPSLTPPASPTQQNAPPFRTSRSIPPVPTHSTMTSDYSQARPGNPLFRAGYQYNPEREGHGK